MKWRLVKRQYRIIDDDIIYEEAGLTYVKGKDGSVTQVGLGKKPRVYTGKQAESIWNDLLSKLKGL